MAVIVLSHLNIQHLFLYIFDLGNEIITLVYVVQATSRGRPIPEYHSQCIRPCSGLMLPVWKKNPHTTPVLRQSLGGMKSISTTSFQNWKLQAVIGQLLWAEFKRLSLTLFCIIYPSFLSLLIYTNECNTLTSPLFMMVVQHVLPNLFF